MAYRKKKKIKNREKSSAFHRVSEFFGCLLEVLALIQCAFIGIHEQIIQDTAIFLTVVKTGTLNGGFV